MQHHLPGDSNLRSHCLSTSNPIADDKLLVLPTLTYPTHFDNENMKMEAAYAFGMLTTLPTSTQCKDKSRISFNSEPLEFLALVTNYHHYV
jgi:hypothetical protein